MKQRLYILFFFLLFSIYSSAQQKAEHWLTIEETNYSLCNLSLNILHHPTLANNPWISIQIENKDAVTQNILNCYLEVKVKAYNINTEEVLKEGMFSTSDASELFDHLGQNPLEVPKLNPGLHTISSYISTRCSNILSIPNSKFIHTDMSIRFLLELEGTEKVKLEWDDLTFEFDWYSPNSQEINQIQNKLNILLQEPQNEVDNYFILKTLLNQAKIIEKITDETFVNSLEKYKNYPDQKIAILHFLNTTFSSNPSIKDYYKNKIKQKDALSLNDLKELPNLWDNDYSELLKNWLEVAPLNIQIRIYDILFLRQQKWIKDKSFCSDLSNILLEQYGDILYQLPDDLNEQQLRMWGSLATALGKTGDASAIGIICPFLENKKNLWGREMVLFTESLTAPRPTRVCDIALEAILNLQFRDKTLFYNKNGFSPPYVYGESEVIIENVRNKVISELINSNICSYKSR